MRVYCGIDLGQTLHRVCVLDRQGQTLEQLKVANDRAGLSELMQQLRVCSATRTEVHIAVEDPNHLFVLALDAARYRITPISPLAASRYRNAHRTAGSKSDRTDAIDLAEMVRTEFGRLQPLYHDSATLLALHALSRAHEDQRHLRRAFNNRLWACLKTFYPAALATFSALDGIDARTALQLMPTPSAARSVRVRTLERALRDAGRQLAVEARAQRIVEGLREPTLHRLAVEVERIKGTQVLLLVDQLNQCIAAEEQLSALMLKQYVEHPLHKIMTSFPGLSGMLGARLLAELGDDPTRFTNAQALRGRAGTSPITQRTGTSLLSVSRRLAYNHRLGQLVVLWALVTAARWAGSPPPATTPRWRASSTCSRPTCSTGNAGRPATSCATPSSTGSSTPTTAAAASAA